MNETFPILSALIWLPALGALFIAVARYANKGEVSESFERGAFVAALVASGATFALSIVALMAFNPTAEGFQFVEDVEWFPGANYRVGVDGHSILLIVLTTFLTPLCIWASWGSIKTRVTSYLVCFLLLETLMIGVFCALDLMLFYIFFGNATTFS